MRFSSLVIVATMLLSTAFGMKIMQTPDGQQNVLVDVYGHCIMQMRLTPNTNDFFYQVEDVIVHEPHTDDQLAVECNGDKSHCTVTFAEVPYKDISLDFTIVGETLKVVHKNGEKILSNTEVALNKPNSPFAKLEFPQAARLYGVPQHATDLVLKHDVEYQLYNLDVFHYKLDDPGGIYGSIPFLMAHSAKHTTGVLFLNSAEAHVKVFPAGGLFSGPASPGVEWRAEVGITNIVFFPGGAPKDVQFQHSFLTGRTMLPPLFSLGYHQCRWNYRSSDDCLEVDSGFDHHNIPYDVLWLDIEHADSKKYFTWDKHNFPNPKELIDKIASHGRKMVTIVDPHVKREAGYWVYDQATEKGFFVKTTSGADYEGHCWPGQSSWVDYYNKNARDWYSTMFSFDNYKESTPDLYTWIDMNEPSVFNSHQVTMDRDAVHSDAKGNKVAHRYLHNMYGFYHTMSVYEGQLLRIRELNTGVINRPFILTRSFFAGSQRYAAMWTGDNMGQWDHLQKSIPMLLSLSLSNFPFVGADVGGFFFNPEAELMIRWMQAGAFYPFFRGHAHLETKRREPWLFGEEATIHIRNAIILRYTLMPYHYTNFYEAHILGTLPMRPLFFEFPAEDAVQAEQQSFMLGSGLFVRPVLEEKATQVSFHLPENNKWFDYFTGAALAPGTHTINVNLGSVPVYLRGGNIVPTKHRVRRSTAAMAFDPYTLHVALDDQQTAKGAVFSDDGLTFNYQKGQFMYRSLTFANNVLKNRDGSSGAAGQNYVCSSRVERVAFYGLTSAPKRIVATYDAPLNSELDIPVGGIKKEIELVFEDLGNNVWSIRRPNLYMDADWSIVLEM